MSLSREIGETITCHCVQCKMDPDSGEPLDELTPAAVESLEELGCPCTKVSQVLETKDSNLYTTIQKGLDKANKEAISKAQKVSL